MIKMKLAAIFFLVTTVPGFAAQTLTDPQLDMIAGGVLIEFHGLSPEDRAALSALIPPTTGSPTAYNRFSAFSNRYRADIRLPVSVSLASLGTGIGHMEVAIVIATSRGESC